MLGKKDLDKPYTLIITTVCGGGHLQAAHAFKNAIRSENPETEVLQIDIFNDWLGKVIGGFLTQRWNAPLRKGHNFLSLCYSYFGIPFADPLFFLPLFVQALVTFNRYPITRIIDTQPVGTCAVTLALLISNKLKKQSLKIEKILTEIPTKKAVHFFHPLKLLPQPLRNLIDLFVVEPLPDEKGFWPKYTGLKETQIKKIAPPLRSAFFLPDDKVEKEIYISFSSHEEKTLILSIARIKELVTLEDDLSVTLKLPKNAHVTTIMLGSQPKTKTIYSYLEKFYSLAAKQYLNKNYLIFVLGNQSIQGWEELKNHWDDKVPLKNFHPILLSMQTEKTVATLLKSSNRTITRSGGLTSMELLKTNQRHALIHSDVVRKMNPVLKKMPPWEIGNALVLMEKIGAKITHPDHIDSLE